LLNRNDNGELKGGGAPINHCSMDPGKVLILNQTFEPLQVCSARRAVVLLFTGKAEGIENTPRVFRSPSVAICLPSVIRLHHFVKKPVPPTISFNKKNILKRDGYTCQYCGRNSGERMTIDHVIPKSQGGRTVWENVVSACRACNLKKGNKGLTEAGMYLRRKPVRPLSVSYLGILAHASQHLEVWKKYLPHGADEFWGGVGS
jgi:5-methylcytosine-specific restriction endonuclease McrA